MSFRRCHHSAANTNASSPATPAIHGQYQPVLSVSFAATGEAGSGAAGVAIVGGGAAAVGASAGCVAGSVGEIAGVARAMGGACCVDAGPGFGATVLPVATVWFGDAVGVGLGTAVWAGLGSVVVTTGLSRSTGPCDPGGAGRTVAPGRRQSLVDWAASGAEASDKASAMAPTLVKRLTIGCIIGPVTMGFDCAFGPRTE
ncbi:MAG: hypothetical protein ACLGHF_03250 [Alphaproteobacteria bacterium]